MPGAAIASRSYRPVMAIVIRRLTAHKRRNRDRTPDAECAARALVVGGSFERRDGAGRIYIGYLQREQPA